MFYFLSLLHLDKSRGLRTQQHHPAGLNSNQLKKLSKREIRSLTQDVLKQAEVTSRAALIKINIKLQQERAYKQTWPCACNINRQKNKRRVVGIDGQREGGRRRKEKRKTKRLLDTLTNALLLKFTSRWHSSPILRPAAVRPWQLSNQSFKIVTIFLDDSQCDRG